MLDLLWGVYSTECMDKRDRVFALYGLMKNANTGGSKPPTSDSSVIFEKIADYTIPWNKVYEIFAVYFFEAGFAEKMFSHLYYCGTLSQKNKSWPSWVPDWSNPHRRSPLTDPTSLMVFGVRFDSVDSGISPGPEAIFDLAPSTSSKAPPSGRQLETQQKALIKTLCFCLIELWDATKSSQKSTLPRGYSIPQFSLEKDRKRWFEELEQIAKVISSRIFGSQMILPHCYSQSDSGTMGTSNEQFEAAEDKQIFPQRLDDFLEDVARIQMDNLYVFRLSELIDPSIPFNATQNHTHSTWARTFHSTPELYIQPSSLPEVEKALRLAHRCRRRITTTGCGHSPSNITSTSSWLMNLDNFNKILEVNKETCVVRMQAGIRLYQIGAELDKVGLAMPNLGSINQQSIAGAISTGTHGSTLKHGILSASILKLKITLASGKTEECGPGKNEELFRAALLSLGALGVITEITFQAVPAFTLAWQQVVDHDVVMFNAWEKDLWTQTEFVRVWWFPYTRRAVVWTAEKTTEPERAPPKQNYDAWFGYHVYHNLLYLGHHFPRILPHVEWFVFGMQYGFKAGTKTSAVQKSREALLMNCLYSQFVNEWALPLRKGPEALRRLSSWLNQLPPNDPDYVPHGIPFSAKGLYVHAPVEVRVTDTSKSTSPRPYLDPTCTDEPTLYLNATLWKATLGEEFRNYRKGDRGNVSREAGGVEEDQE
ncbi:hypothetical protein G7Y89_g9440 [Cudoniella acicularis]|uniref:D-arabinono-1,4-lactone oxidase n=1 Tax=Cudoniella acicularis TaxID=354080 RepID=A0A8H4W015_9HELO|nr:hypothetical protein G7Y89_g9440 [Cudoniella acicularis]